MPQGKVKKKTSFKKARKVPYLKKQQKKAGIVRGVKTRGKKIKAEKKLGAAIDRNIEAIMAARVLKHGGSLSIIEKPKDLDQLNRAGGPQYGKKKGGARNQLKKKHGELSKAAKHERRAIVKQKLAAGGAAVANASLSSRVQL